MPADRLDREPDRTNHAAEARAALGRLTNSPLTNEEAAVQVGAAIAHALLAIHDRLTRGIETLR